MKHLSVFVDESGDFGEVDEKSPMYLVSLVFHNQANSIEKPILKLNEKLRCFGYGEHAIHTGPLIRRDTPNYHNLSIDERRSLFFALYNFSRFCHYRYKALIVDKREHSGLDLNAALAKGLSRFLKDNLVELQGYDLITVYYDNGQIELSKMLVAVFNSILVNVEFKRVLPVEKKLFQVADLICTIELLSLKRESRALSSSEEHFFYKPKELQGVIKEIRKNTF